MQVNAETLKDSKTVQYLLIVLRGMGQIMLQENALTGLIFLVGIFLGSIPMGVAAIVATFSGTLTAKMLRASEDDIQKGLYGFSASLTGVALLVFFKPAIIVWVAVIVGAVLASVIQHLFIKKNIPVYTFPFVLVAWVLVFSIQLFFPHVSAQPGSETIMPVSRYAFAFHGFGQVIFQSNIWSGILFFIGVFINAPQAALYALSAAVVGGLLAVVLALPADQVQAGLYSYNTVLCAIVFAGSSIKDGVWVLVSVVFATAISLWMNHYQLLALTFPFVAATWITLIIKKILEKK